MRRSVAGPVRNGGVLGCILVEARHPRGVASPLGLRNSSNANTNPHELREGVDSIRLNAMLSKLPATVRVAARSAFEKQVGGLTTLHSDQPDVQADIDAIASGEAKFAAARAKVSQSVWKDPVTLVLTPGSTPRVEVWRSNPGRRTEAVVISEGAASPEYLSLALRYLARRRARGAQLPGAHIAFHAPAPTSERLPDSWRAYLVAKLAALQAQPITPVADIGTGRSLVIPQVGR